MARSLLYLQQQRECHATLSSLEQPNKCDKGLKTFLNFPALLIYR